MQVTWLSKTPRCPCANTHDEPLKVDPYIDKIATLEVDVRRSCVEPCVLMFLSTRRDEYKLPGYTHSHSKTTRRHHEYHRVMQYTVPRTNTQDNFLRNTQARYWRRTVRVVCFNNRTRVDTTNCRSKRYSNHIQLLSANCGLTQKTVREQQADGFESNTLMGSRTTRTEGFVSNTLTGSSGKCKELTNWKTCTVLYPVL